MDNVFDSCFLVGVQYVQYGDLLIAASMILALTFGVFSVRLLYFVGSNFFLKRSISRLKDRNVVLELRIAAIKARLVGEPSSNSSGKYSEERANGKRLKVHSDSLLANAGDNRVRAKDVAINWRLFEHLS